MQHETCNMQHVKSESEIIVDPSISSFGLVVVNESLHFAANNSLHGNLICCEAASFESPLLNAGHSTLRS